MAMYLAKYKGPPTDFKHKVGHYLTRLWLWSRYSHAELVIDGVCYSSSMRDGGVRPKVIDLTSGRWDVVECKRGDPVVAKAWFEAHDGDLYDYWGLVRWVFPFIPQDPHKETCFESIGLALGLAAAEKLDADDLSRWVQGLD